MLMRLTLAVFVLGSLSGGTMMGPAPATQPATIALADGTVLYPSRYDYRTLVAALVKAGGDPRRVRHVTAPADLFALESGKRYKYALDSSALLCVAPDPADTPKDAYTHPILAGGGWVRCAGFLTLTHDGKVVERVSVDNGSTAYQPAKEGLKEVRAALERLGIAAAAISESEGAGAIMRAQ